MLASAAVNHRSPFLSSSSPAGPEGNTGRSKDAKVRLVGKNSSTWFEKRQASQIGPDGSSNMAPGPQESCWVVPPSDTGRPGTGYSMIWELP